MKFSGAYVNAAATLLLVVLQVLRTEPGIASAATTVAATAGTDDTGPRRRTQWWADALGAGNAGGGGFGGDRPVPRPTNPPPTLPTGGDYLRFVDREPDFRLGRCEGDCDKDSVRSTLLF